MYARSFSLCFQYCELACCTARSLIKGGCERKTWQLSWRYLADKVGAPSKQNHSFLPIQHVSPWIERYTVSKDSWAILIENCHRRPRTRFSSLQFKCRVLRNTPERELEEVLGYLKIPCCFKPRTIPLVCVLTAYGPLQGLQLFLSFCS